MKNYPQSIIRAKIIDLFLLVVTLLFCIALQWAFA